VRLEQRCFGPFFLCCLSLGSSSESILYARRIHPQPSALGFGRLRTYFFQPTGDYLSATAQNRNRFLFGILLVVLGALALSYPVFTLCSSIQGSGSRGPSTPPAEKQEASFDSTDTRRAAPPVSRGRALSSWEWAGKVLDLETALARLRVGPTASVALS